jgi:hypothetical protein
VPYREEDPSRAAEHQAVRAAEKTELARAADAMKRGSVWTPGLRRLARGILLTLAGLGALIALGYGGSRAVVYMRPCHGEWARCVDKSHAEVCGADGQERTAIPMRCKTACDFDSEVGCEQVDDPLPGEACLKHNDIALGRPEELTACTPDGRAVMSCRGGEWKIGRWCADDTKCDSTLAPRMGYSSLDLCVKR